MSYSRALRPIGDRVVTRKRALGGTYDEYDLQKKCLDQANRSPQVMGIDAIISSLAKSWNPTGFYRPEDIQQLLSMFADETPKVGAAIAAAPLSTGDAQQAKDIAFGDIARKCIDRGKAYSAAIADARARGASVISAPALKSWVIASMQSISDGYVTAAVLECRQNDTWLEKWVAKAYAVMVAIGAVAAKIIGVAVKVGEKVVDAIDTAGDIAAFVVKYAPYAGAALGAYLLYHFVKKRTS